MSLTYAALSLGVAGVATAATYAKRKYEQKEFQSQAWASIEDVRGWKMVGEHRVDEGGWPLPAFIYGSMRRNGDVVHDWTTDEVSRHALISAPSGAGKTWTVFYPTLMYGWTHSAVVHVRKKELADLTAGYRALYSDVIWFDPTSLGSARYNPLDRIRALGEHAIRDAQNLVEHLSASSGDGGDATNAVFSEAAKDFAAAAIIYVMTHERASTRNFSGLRAAFSDCATLAGKMIESHHPDPHVRSELAISANALLSNPSERFVGAVEGVLRSWLRVYQDTILAQVTSRSDFSPEDLVCGRRPVTLYIHLPPSDDKRLAPFVRLMVSQILDDLMTWEKRSRSGAPKNWKLAWVLDEAWRLGKIEAMEGALADMRSYGMRALLGVQGLSQIIDLYGVHNSVFNNCRWITSWQNGYDECKRVADMLGDEEREKKSTSTSFGMMGDPKGTSTSKTMEWRPVIQAAHVGNIPKDRIVIFGEEKPILARRTNPATWKKLIRPLEREAVILGTMLPPGAVEPDSPLLPYLTRCMPSPPDTRLLPPPGPEQPDPPGPEQSGPSTPQPPPQAPPPGEPFPPSPKRPRRRL
jgi:type IV secretion system protein VirD4